MTGTLGSFFKDDSICGYMDCETMFGTSEAGFAFSQTQKPDDNNIEIIVKLFNGKYRNEQIVLSLNIPNLPDCGDYLTQ